MISKYECNILKGWAIIAITLHNYCHWLPFASNENEYTWKEERTLYFFQHIGDNFIINLFSFWGHYGVAIFVFLTGYGLAIKYDSNIKERINKCSFIINHYKKLLLLLFPSLLLFWVTSWVFHSNITHFSFSQLITQTTLIINLIPSTIIQIRPGPYWYFGLSIQLYIIYILFVYKRRLRFLYAICIFSLVFLTVSNGHYQAMEWIKYNFIGSFIPFTIGISLGRMRYDILSHSRWVYYIVTIIAILVIILSELSYYSWIFSSIWVIIIAICFLKYTNKLLLSKAIQSIGVISNLIFIIHPLIRELVFLNCNSVYSHPYTWLIIYLSISLLISYLTKLCLSKIKREKK